MTFSPIVPNLGEVREGVRVMNPSGGMGTVQRVRRERDGMRALVSWDSRSRTWVSALSLIVLD
jgi:hypothetical protein